MKKLSFTRKCLRMLIALEVLILLFATLSILKSSTRVCEFFATTFSRAWIFVFGNLFGLIPVSLYELFLIAAIGLAIFLLVYVIVSLCKRKWKRLLSTALITLLAVFSFLNIYTATASFSYGREHLPDEVYTEYTAADFDFEQAVDLTRKLIDRANLAYRQTAHDSDGNIVYPYKFSEISDLLAVEYKRLKSSYFSSYTPRGKRILNKTIMSEMHITGVFFAPFGEANVNGNETNLYLPHTLAHEMAHGKGVMREYEANIVAYYICITSDNPYLSYGALVGTLWSALSLVMLYPNSLQTYEELHALIDEGIWKERDNYNAFYSQFTLLDNLGEWFNNLYLKLNKQEDGTGSYVKPGETVGTGDKDDDGFEIMQILEFSATQNLLIKLYKEGRLG